MRRRKASRYLLGDLVRGELPPPAFSAGWLGLMTSLLILIGFALPPMLQLRTCRRRACCGAISSRRRCAT